jgi:dCMP deaminase
MFMDFAHTAAKRGGCFRGNVGAVLVRDNNVLSIGYNGPPPGADDCYGTNCPKGATGGCTRSWHAEANAIKRCTSVPPNGADLYTTVSPCAACATMIGERGIARVFFAVLYRDEQPVWDLCQPQSARAVECFRVTPAGHVINFRTRELVEQ